MSLLLQELLVAVLVAGCALFSAWRLASARVRLAALEALGALPGLRSVSWLAALRLRTQQDLGGGCAGCAKGTADARPGARVRDISSSR
jgi:hypothetical protein